MTALGNFSCPDCLHHGTALFAHMGAVTEPALPQIRSELRETVGDAVLVHLKILFHLKGRKARRVCQIAAGAGIKLHLACGMFSSSQLFADLSGGKLEFRGNGIEQRERGQ